MLSYKLFVNVPHLILIIIIIINIYQACACHPLKHYLETNYRDTKLLQLLYEYFIYGFAASCSRDYYNEIYRICILCM